jgi:hypothetical protein
MLYSIGRSRSRLFREAKRDCYATATQRIENIHEGTNIFLNLTFMLLELGIGNLRGIFRFSVLSWYSQS